jgi:uncharacterized protein (UPF0332 family)
MKARDLVRVAAILVDSNARRPSQASLKRAVSSLYYALFHSLAQSCADSFIGGPNAGRSTQAWQRTYRSLDHGKAKDTFLRQNPMAALSSSIQAFAAAFVKMQERRHDADYNPEKRFRKSEVQSDLREVEAVVTAFERCSLSERRAFAAYVLLKERKS